MPIYEYNCNNCNYRFEKMVQRWDAEENCPLCMKKAQKLMSTFSVGEAHGGATGLPDEFRPKMCTNC